MLPGLSTISNTVAAGLGAALAAALTFGTMTAYVHFIAVPNARDNERAIVLAEANQRAIDLINERSKDNAELSGFDAAAMCAEFGGRWVLPDGCID